MRIGENIGEIAPFFFLLTQRFLLTFLFSRRFFERKYSPKQKASRNGALKLFSKPARKLFGQQKCLMKNKICEHFPFFLVQKLQGNV